MIFLAKARRYEPQMAPAGRRIIGRPGRVRSVALGPYGDYESMLNHGTYGMVSAERSNLPRPENVSRTDVLYHHLRAAGLRPTAAEGIYGGVPEKSFFIRHPDPRQLHAALHHFTNRFNQESYIVRHQGEHRMVFPNGDAEHPAPFHLKGSRIIHHVGPEEDRTALWTPGGHVHTFRMEDFWDNPKHEGLGRSFGRNRRVHHAILHTPDGPYHFTMHFDPTPHPNDGLC